MTNIAQGLSNEASVLKDVVTQLPAEVGHRLLDDVQNHLGKVVLENAAGAGMAMLLSRSPAAMAWGLSAVALAGAGIDLYKIGSKAWGADSEAQRKDAVNYGTGLIGGQAAALIESTPGVVAGAFGPALAARMFKPIPSTLADTEAAALTADPPLAAKADLAVTPKAESVAPSGDAALTPKIISFDQKAYLGQGDQGIVYDNGNGTVTKVLTDPELTASDLKYAHNTLHNLGVKVPKALDTGVTADGRQAIVLEKIGAGDNLREQIIFGQIDRTQIPEISRQYYQMGDKIGNAGYRVDWNIKNMSWHNNELWLLDPSFLKPEPLSADFVNFMAGSALLPRASVMGS